MRKVLEVAQHMWDTGQLMDYTEVPLQPYLENGLERPHELRAWKFKQNKIRRINERVTDQTVGTHEVTTSR